MIVLELGQVGRVAIRDELQRGDRGRLLSVRGSLRNVYPSVNPITWHCCCSFLVGRPTM